eukprot:291794-Chlamydomonas_euryale.AAC.9
MLCGILTNCIQHKPASHCGCSHWTRTGSLTSVCTRAESLHDSFALELGRAPASVCTGRTRVVGAGCWLHSCWASHCKGPRGTEGLRTARLPGSFWDRASS